MCYIYLMMCYLYLKSIGAWSLLSSSGARWFKEKRADGRQQRAIDFFMALIWKISESPGRAQRRSKTYDGIAEAMAQQWGAL